MDGALDCLEQPTGTSNLPGPLQNARAEPSAAVHAYQRSAAPRKVPVKVLTSGQIKASKEEVRTRVRNPTI
jgi:hypothetical protein